MKNMATMVKLGRLTGKVVEETFIQNRDAEENRLKEYEAALKIQSWFRAVRVRSYIKFLHKCAVTVQRHWRGFLGRGAFRTLVKNSVFVMRMNFYNKMVVRIQKRWRGYYVRKYVHNYYARKRYLEGLQIKNQIVRSELSEYAEMHKREREKRRQELAEKKEIYNARKNHYLLSTHQVSGIYNTPYKPFPDEMEYQLMSVKPLSHKRPLRPRDSTMGLVDPSPPRVPPALPQSAPLPPIDKKKPQGPFRQPTEVYSQRYRPLEPTLRVATDYTSEEEARVAMKRQEWEGRINDNTFLPFTRRERPYSPLLHTTSQYGALPYGSRHFRHEKKETADDRFKLVCSPIPILEKFKETYSKGQVAL
ncbi:SPATA17 [Branchiostoma lanceolatum]|uniref:SPATA17 protein n=1 Tax=Branchiostoma lanceolatum TaxID=7740 RepID=A0A8J9ZTG0_BRALA|nr:SPATA17 [Branchiostoma lanceolatum]